MGMGEGEEGGSQILSEDAAEQRRDGMRFFLEVRVKRAAPKASSRNSRTQAELV